MTTRWGAGCRPREQSGERGSISIEAAIVFAVVMVTFFSLMVAAGRIVGSETKVRSAAHAAARAASLEGTYADAVAAAEATALANMADADLVCGDQSVQVTSAPGDFVPGGWVQVEVRCTPQVLPFGITPTQYAYPATEVIDEFRSEP